MGRKSRLKKERRNQKNAGTEITDKIDISYYVVAFVDVLSQKDKLRKIDKLPDNDEEMQKFVVYWKETYGVIHLFRTLFDEFHKGNMNVLSKDEPSLNKKQKELLNRHVTNSIKKQVFSDSMIYYASLAESQQSTQMTNIYYLLTSVATVFITALSAGLICRGGIEIGIAGEFFGKEVYGPALYQAYQLENDIAQYPRIVIGKELIRYIWNKASRKANNKEEELSILTAKDCKSWICEDVDGTNILDYLGKAPRDLFPSMTDLIHKATEFVESEWHKFKKEQNLKLAGRYFLLRQYLLSRQKQFWN